MTNIFPLMPEDPDTLPTSAEHTLSKRLDAEVQTRNQDSVSRACQQAAGPAAAASPDFLSRLMGALDSVEQDNEYEDFETLSAWHDDAFELDPVQLAGTPAAQPQLNALKQLSQAFQALPVMAAPAGFADKVMAALPAFTETHNHQALSQALQALPSIEAPAGFAERVMAVLPADLDMAQNQAALGEALRALPGMEAPLGFAERVMAALPADLNVAHNEAVLAQALKALPAIEAPAGFVAKVMAALPSESAVTERNIQVLGEALRALPVLAAPAGFAERVMAALPSESEITEHNARVLGNALRALPQPEVPTDFVARVMVATERAGKARLFALPAVLRTRTGQMVAGLALFGMLALLSQNLLNNTGGGNSGMAAVPSDHIVQVEYQAEDVLFESTWDSEVDNSFENNYNQMIGG
ncbi:MAG: hypothetical protein ACO1RX_10420 [Candidatus Sericytochromatia bacterium]